MESLKNKLNKLPLFVRSRYMILVVLVTIIFLIMTIYAYKHYIKSSVSPSYVANREYTTGDDSGKNSVDLYFFYTNWCPHCKNAMPIWKQFKNETSNKTFNGKSINFIEVDCEKDTKLADQFNVKGYPTIKLVNGNQVIEYDAKPDMDTLREFINTSL